MNRVIKPEDVHASDRLGSDPEFSGGRKTSGKVPPNPRSDVGTIVLHWATAIAVIVSFATGLRIGGDALDSVVGKALWNVLPQGEIWTWHFVASLMLVFCAAAYVLYMERAGLLQRISLARLRMLTMPASARLRWNAVNVLLHWAIYGILTGSPPRAWRLYLGYGGWVVTVHGLLATTTLVYIGVHIFTHSMYGGLGQLLRLFRPTPLAESTMTRSRPLLAGLSLGLALALALVALDFGTRDTLKVASVAEAPKLDGRAGRCGLGHRAPRVREDGARRQSRRNRHLHGRGARRRGR